MNNNGLLIKDLQMKDELEKNEYYEAMSELLGNILKASIYPRESNDKLSDHKSIIDFLGTSIDKEKLKNALEVILEFKSFESRSEWLNIPFLAWAKLEQLEEYLEYLVNGKDLKEDTLEYLKHIKEKDSN